jgi:hypothetical protein
MSKNIKYLDNCKDMSNNKEEQKLISFDYALTRSLCNEANYDILEGFLNELFDYSVKVKNVVKNGRVKEKYNRVEMLVENKKGDPIMVELYFSAEVDCLLQMLYSSNQILVEYADVKSWTCTLRKVISIYIDCLNWQEGSDYVYRNSMTFSDIHSKEEVELDALQWCRYKKKKPTEICPEYYILQIKNFDDVVEDKLDEWVYFFKHNNIKDEFTAKGLDKVRKVLLYENLTPEEQAEYDHLQEIRLYENDEV